MKRAFVLAFIVLLALPSFAQEKLHSVQLPIFNQLVQTRLPSTWKLDKPHFERYNPKGHYIIEFIKKNEKDIFAIQGFQNAANNPKMHLKNLEAFIMKAVRSLSPKDFMYQNVAQTFVQGYPAIISIIGCGKIPQNIGKVKKGTAEFGLYMFVRGKQDVYIFQRSWKTKGLKKKQIPVSEDELKKWVYIMTKHTSFL